MGVFKKLFKLKPKKIAQEPEKKNSECWYNNVHEQGENHGAIPVEGAGSVNEFEHGQTKNSAMH